MTDTHKEQKADIEASAYRLLARRDHARGELQQKLLNKDFPPGLVDEVLDSLENSGYVNDEEFALHQGAILARKGWGPRQIEAKLRKRGILEHHIDQTLDAIRLDESFLLRARYLLESKFGAPDKLSDIDRKRAFRHLVYRGFSPATARRLLFD